MFNKFSTKSLIITFAVLLIVVTLFLIKDSIQGERSFPSNIVSIDTAKVTAIYLYPKSINHNKVKIYKEGNVWKVLLTNNKSAIVPNIKAQHLLSQILSIKPTSVAAESADKWKDFNVDTSGTRVEVFDGSDNVLDFTIGKFAYRQPQSMSTYIRVGNDKNVYLTDGFLDLTFNHGADYFRDNTLINDDYNNWNKVTFTYPADSSFQLIKKNNLWFINNRQTDSAVVVNYLRSISNLSQYFYVDNPAPQQLMKAKFTLSIQSSALGLINVYAYGDTSDCIINSSQNPDSYFDGEKENFWKRVFVGKEHFISKK